MLLTNSEIMDINQNAEFDSAIGYARAIESSVLEKLKAQEPEKTKIECVTGAIYKHISGALYPREVIAAAQYIVHRYCTTLPPADVVRDDPRIAELEAVLRECRETLISLDTNAQFTVAKEAIAKIDEVLNVPDISRTA